MSPLEAQSHAFCRHKLSDPIGTGGLRSPLHPPHLHRHHRLPHQIPKYITGNGQYNGYGETIVLNVSNLHMPSLHMQPNSQVQQIKKVARDRERMQCTFA